MKPPQVQSRTEISPSRPSTRQVRRHDHELVRQQQGVHGRVGLRQLVVSPPCSCRASPTASPGCSFTANSCIRLFSLFLLDQEMSSSDFFFFFFLLLLDSYAFFSSRPPPPPPPSRTRPLPPCKAPVRPPRASFALLLSFQSADSGPKVKL